MSSIYKHLSKADLKLEKDKPALLPPEDVGPAKLHSLRGVKTAIVFAFLLSLAAFGMMAYFFHALRSERQERRQAENAYTTFSKEAQILQAESRQYRDEMSRLRDQLKAYSDERQNLKKELNDSRAEISGLEKKVRDLEMRNREIEKKTRELQRSAPPAARVDAGTLPALTPAAPAGSSDLPTVSIKKIAPLDAESLLPPAPASTARPVEAALAVAPSGETIAGEKKVMTVNRKFNFVVMNLGLKDGIKMGDRITVLRDGDTVAVVEIEKLYDNFAAATILEEKKDRQIAEGDLVRKS